MQGAFKKSNNPRRILLLNNIHPNSIAGLRPFPGLEWNGNLTLSQNKIKNYMEYVTVYDSYYRQADGGLEPYTEKSYFPQAGIHVMTNVAVRF